MNEGMTTCGKPSRGRYVQGCRCYMCRVANAEYARANANSKGSRDTAMVSASSTAKARAKVQGWLDDGISLREICRATGVGRSAMRTLISGKHPNARRCKNGGYAKSHRMARTNYDAIMGCDRPSAPLGGQTVDAGSLNSALSWLYAHGVTPYRVSMESGIPLGTVYGLGAKGSCEYKTLARLASVAEKLKREAR